MNPRATCFVPRQAVNTDASKRGLNSQAARFIPRQAVNTDTSKRELNPQAACFVPRGVINANTSKRGLNPEATRFIPRPPGGYIKGTHANLPCYSIHREQQRQGQEQQKRHQHQTQELSWKSFFPAHLQQLSPRRLFADFGSSDIPLSAVPLIRTTSAPEHHHGKQLLNEIAPPRHPLHSHASLCFKVDHTAGCNRGHNQIRKEEARVSVHPRRWSV